MKLLKLFALLLLVQLCAVYAQAPGTSSPGQRFANIGDFVLSGGDTIYDCTIGYRTFGTLNKEKSNAIVYPTWFNGTSEQIKSLIGKDKLIDSTGYFIIAIDALGNGVSTSPSNSRRQPGLKFPQFTMADIVRAEHQMVTRSLGIKHLFAAIGGSMGSMQVLEWIAAYPDFIDKAIPYVPTPWASPYDQIHWQIGLKLIETGRKYNVPDKEVSQLLNMVMALVARTPHYTDSTLDRSRMDAYFKTFDREASSVFPPINWAYQSQAMLSHDITAHYGGSKQRTAEAIKSKVLMIIADKDHILYPGPAKELSALMKSEVLLLESDCGHLSVNCEMEKCRERIHRFLSE